MKAYPVTNLRNICLLGHGGEGKTSLAEAMLFMAKATDRLGKVVDGTTVCDFDAEEIKRKISVSTSIAPIEWNNHKINIIDTPGYFDFAGEVIEGVRVADGGVIVVSASKGLTVGAEKSWKYLKDGNIPALIFISKVDEENANFGDAVESLREKLGKSICPLIFPIIENKKPVGNVEVITKTAKKYDEKGNAVEIAIPDSIKSKIDNYNVMLNEAIAETSEELMEKYFAGEAFTHEEYISGLCAGIKDGSIVPVLCGSAIELAGIKDLLDGIVEYMPCPSDRGAIKAVKPGTDQAVNIKVDPAEPVAAIVFKTVADPYVGKMSYFKVVSGSLKADMPVVNAKNGQTEKISHLYILRGKKQIEVEEIGCGDIGVATKLASFNTGDTFCSPSRLVELEGISFPSPCLTLAVEPKAKGDEEKISSGLQRLMDEDLTFKYTTNTETKQQLISGMGEIHLDVIVSKLKTKFGTSVELKKPRVPYRETIRKKVRVEGKHKKQSGGHGQYGHVWIEFEPGETQELTFAESIFGGAVPKNFFPAVEKGLRECAQKGVLAGYPVVNLKATLVDGSYHPVDSSEMSFKIAASLAYKTGLAQASPVLLEPIGTLKVYIPDSLMGDIIGDINKRRGRVLGMNPAEGGMQEVVAEVPMAEMHDYAIVLRSISQGRGQFTFDFERYEEAPAPVAQKVIEETKKLNEEE